MLNIYNGFMYDKYSQLYQLWYMTIHIGNKIKAVVSKKGMTVSEFGRRINKSRENVYSIFKRKSIDTGLLTTIGNVLEYDFFQYYTNLNTEIIKLKEENNTLKELVKLLQSKQIKKK